jgi:hypothetical protein
MQNVQQVIFEEAGLTVMLLIAAMRPDSPRAALRSVRPA